MQRGPFSSSTIGTILRLIALSVVVGIVLSALNIRPENLLYHVRLLVDRLYALGFGTVEWAFRYFLLGAVIVVPIWGISRLFALGRRRDDDKR